MTQFSEAPIISIPIASIVIPEERQRREAKPDEALIESIRSQGLLNPIIIRAGNVLVAGERRLKSFIELGRDTIPARNFEDLSDEHAFLVELQENFARKQLSWQDEARAVRDYHQMRLAAIPHWTQLGTANDIGMNESSVGVRLAVAEELSDEAVSGCATLTAAYNFISKRAERRVAAARAKGFELGDEIAKRLAPTVPQSKAEATASLLASLDDPDADEAPATAPSRSTALLSAGKAAAAFLANAKPITSSDQLPAGPILQADFHSWAESFSDIPFDVIHCDFPYGKGFEGSKTSKQAQHDSPLYDDSEDIMWELLETLLRHRGKLLAPQAHILFWHERAYETEIIRRFVEAGFRHCSYYPFIWTKGNQGTPGDHARQYRHCYEQAHLFSWGDRKTIKLVQDHFEHKVENDSRIHLTPKSIPMLKHALSAIVDEHTRLLDPTCGSGSAIIAANLLGADYAIGLELDSDSADIARLFVERKVKEGDSESSSV